MKTVRVHSKGKVKNAGKQFLKNWHGAKEIILGVCNKSYRS